MQLDLKLTENLILHYIEDNYSENDELITVFLSFTYFGIDAAAYLSVSNLENDDPSYAMVEGAGELHDSFTEQIEDPEIFEEMKPLIKAFINQWNHINKD